jgi:alanyl-tRNA synthetase
MNTKPELKIIADHLRSSCFLIADGILPSNEGRGYVLRRIMRRAMRQIHKLGSRHATMYKLVDALINEMGAAYPELARARDTIIETLKNEEEKFRETLDKGLKLLDEELLAKKTSKFSGAAAFKLYDTFGFPLDLTQDILKEKNIEVDLEEFNQEMEKQRDRARKNWSGSGEVKEDETFFKLKETHGETEFLGYNDLSSKAKIIALTVNGIVLDKTTFYATSGGQKGDDGKIILASDDSKFADIFETRKFAGNFFVHFLNGEENYKFNVGDEVIAKVNSKTRHARAANHSATHLMHKALKEILGNSISQKGSNVDAESFTFDFNFNRAMTVDEIKKVENIVNQNIKETYNVNTNLMALEKARESGAESLPDQLR